MAKVQIVTDSAAKFTPAEIEEYGIKVVPLSVQIDGTIYQDGITISAEEFLEKMQASDNLPHTSQPSIGTFKEVYDECYAEDPEASVLSLHLSSGLSGTVNAANQANALTKADVHAFDTLSADRSEAFVVLAAARAAKAGKSLEEVIRVAEQARDETYIYLSFRSLDNMVAGGRLSKTQGLIGNLLNIKVGAKVDEEGKVDVVVKGRGLKTIKAFNDDVIEKMKSFSTMKSIGVTYTGITDEAEAMAKRLNEIWPDIDILVSVATPIISTHTGMGALAILFEAE
ncbi:DegV family protein [Fructobacillus pseudoficulneus]|uniref:DegV family protein n=1 Tax=Fructobacillus pseudoficulneus TaxID=220714 RepID=A0A3F3H6G2_9LACO|nr:DegV family protein [Fructobacillus pseudoficulneus]GAP02163.1 DegV family protein [Fructobacillus pseudoficulneus]SEH35944.1 EDD domain protein, DegV family [Fructobacillus pseudoficulneus]